MKTFVRHLEKLDAFVERILQGKPDFIVPVAKKGVKLLRLSHTLPRERVRLLEHFRLIPQDLRGKRIAVVDDAAQYTASLMEHRSYFESKGALVDTFAFVGHDRLNTGESIVYDPQCHIETFLPDPVYQEYILQQAHYLLQTGNHSDLDHLQFSITISAASARDLLVQLNRFGRLIQHDAALGPHEVHRSTLDDIRTFGRVPYLNHSSIAIGPIRKLRLAYNAAESLLTLSPLVFPTWRHEGKREAEAMTFEHVPFQVPLPGIPDGGRSRQAALLRTYLNLTCVYQVSLFKAVVQAVPVLANALDTLQSHSRDLASLIDKDSAASFLNSASTFLRAAQHYDYHSHVSRPRPPRTPRYSTFGAVIRDLRDGYERAKRRKRTPVGVHFTMPLDSLFKRYHSAEELSEYLDLYCDLGVIVPMTVQRRGRVGREVRSGEPSSDVSWRRTQVLIPLAIQQFLVDTNDGTGSIGPTVLNKMLSCFQYDYPADANLQLHCMYGEPAYFGSLVHVHHLLRAPTRLALYEAKKISPEYRYDTKSGSFRVTDIDRVLEKARDLFDDRLEVPYSEMITYFRYLAFAYKLHKSVDVLNALSICRDEQYFLAHAHFNATSAAAALASVRALLAGFPTLPVSRRPERAHPQRTETVDIEEFLSEVALHSQSGLAKVALMRAFPATMASLTAAARRHPEFVKVSERFNMSVVPPSPDASQTLTRLELVFALAGVLAHTVLAAITKDVSHEREILKLNAEELLRGQGVVYSPTPRLLDWQDQSMQAMVEQGVNLIDQTIRLVPSGTSTPIARARKIEIERARNLATSIAYKDDISVAVLLYADFSGLRRVPEPKEAVVAEYYRIAKSSSDRSGGELLYGGNGGDDAFAWLFRSAAHAVTCAQAIKQGFAENVFLSLYDVKFGLSVTPLPASKEVAIIQAWGTAKDSCELKTTVFRNKGHLIIGAATRHALAGLGEHELVQRAVPVVVNDAQDSEAEYFRITGIEPL